MLNIKTIVLGGLMGVWMDGCKNNFKDFFLIAVCWKIKFKKLWKLGAWMDVKGILKIITAIINPV